MNYILDANLSWKAKGLLSFLIVEGKELPYEVKAVTNSFVRVSSDGKGSVKSGLKELESNGYIERYQEKVNSFSGSVDWIIKIKKI